MPRFVAPLPGSSSDFKVPSASKILKPPIHPRSTTSASTTSTHDEISPNFTDRSVTDEPEELSEAELRRIYEDEEIQRTLALFVTHVSEVILPHSLESSEKGGKLKTIASSPDLHNVSSVEIMPPSVDNGVVDDLPDNDEPGEAGDLWVNVETTSISSTLVEPRQPASLSEWCAMKLASFLPPPRPSQPNPPKVKLSALGLASRRLYLSVFSIYPPFFSMLSRLALWEDWGESAKFCALYWILWTFDLLLPALTFRIFYGLVHRHLVPYPTAAQLRARRRAASEADAVGAAVDSGMVGGNWTSGRSNSGDLEFGARLAWKLFRRAVKGTRKEKKEVSSITDDGKSTDGVELTDDATQVEMEQEVKADVKQQDDWKRGVVAALEELADIHERLRNMFLWRRPAASRTYVVILGVLFVVTLFLPARILAKFVYLLIGVAFWFLVPVLAAMPAEDRSRFPPPFSEFPTDADYAIEVIGQRMARGESVVPLLKAKSKKNKSDAVHSENFTTSLNEPAEDDGLATGSQSSNEAGWNKLQGQAIRAMSWVDQRVKLISGMEIKTAESQVFPAQYSATPGLLTLTRMTLTFIPFLSANRILISVPLAQIRGLKKSGKLGGISIRYMDESDEVVDVKFQWVGKRDELFAKLVGWGGRPWIRV